MQVRQTEHFETWLNGLRDRQARARIILRIDRIEQTGNLGDAKPRVGLFGVRIPYGPGYRIYFIQQGAEVVVLLGGGGQVHAASGHSARKGTRG